MVERLALEPNIVAVSAAMFLMGLGENLWRRFLPKYLELLGAPITAIGLFGTAEDFLDGVYQYPGGWVADRFGRRRTIITGLALFAGACLLLAAGNTLWWFAILLALSGLAIGIFKTGALALIGDISTSTAEHTSIMNWAEGFFAVGAIAGPALLTRLLDAGLSWKWLYVIAGGMCTGLVVLARFVRYPERPRGAASAAAGGTGAALRNPYVLAFSAGAFFYVAAEAAIYVWMPTLLARYTGRAATLAAYSLSIFFLLRAAGRFLGAWVLRQARWQFVLMVFSGCILACFALTLIGGVAWGVFLLPLSGLFMSVMYPTINSKGISCAPKSDHGAAAGVILFFTCISAVVAPLMIGAAGDAFGDIIYGYWIASGFAALLFGGSVLNWALNPTRAVLEARDLTEYVPTRPAVRTHA